MGEFMAWSSKHYVSLETTVKDYILLGDVNLDEQINVTDIVLMISFILDQSTPSENQEIASDINGDGVINVVDIVALVNYILS